MKRNIFKISSSAAMILFFSASQIQAQCTLEIPSTTKVVNVVSSTVNEDSESTLIAKGSAAVTFSGSSNTILFSDGSSGKVLGSNNSIYVGAKANVEISGQGNTVYKAKGAVVSTVAKGNKVKECAKFDIKNSLDAEASAGIEIGGASIDASATANTSSAVKGGANTLVGVGKTTGKIGTEVGKETVEVGKETAEFGKETSVIAGETVIEASADVSNSLIGTWNVTKGMIGDQAYEVKGRIIFHKDGTGYNDYQIKYEGQIIVRQNKFDWKSSATMIATKSAGMAMEWKRLLDEEAKQSAEVQISAEVSMQLMMERRK